MYSETSSRGPPRSSRAAVRTAANTAATTQRTRVVRPPKRLLKKLDSGDAAVGVPEDERHQTLPCYEVRGPRPRSELEARLVQRAANNERRECPRRHLDLLCARNRRRAGDSEDGKVTTRVLRGPVLASGRVRRQDRVHAVDHQVERREEVPAPRLAQELRTERRAIRA